MDIGETLSGKRRAPGRSVDDLAVVTGMTARQPRAPGSSAIRPPEAAGLRRMLRLCARKTGLASEAGRLLGDHGQRIERGPVSETAIPRFLLKQSLVKADGLRKKS